MLNWFRIILSTLHIIWKDTSPEQSQNIDNNLHYLTKPILTKTLLFSSNNFNRNTNDTHTKQCDGLFEL